MKLGADRKRIAILGSLTVLGGYLFYTNVLNDSGAPPAGQKSAARPAAVIPARPTVPAAASQDPARRVGSRVRASEEWHPTLKRRADDPLDPLSVDPTLRLELLAKVQAVQLDGGSRNVFQFSAPPPPPLPKEPKILPKTPAQLAQQAKPVNAGPPQPPPPPPIPLKYYGFSSARGPARKTAFFLDGEDILVAAEGEVVKRRYKVVRIGINSVVMEDTESKSQQTLPMQEEVVG